MATRSVVPRGIRNNNPGNIRKTADRWEGIKPLQTDDAFVQFISPVYGFRAMARILKNYERRGLTTVSEIISTYAPPTENDTHAYINVVADQLQVLPDQVLDLDTQLLPLIKAMVTVEQGAAFARFYSDDTIQGGIALA